MPQPVAALRALLRRELNRGLLYRAVAVSGADGARCFGGLCEVLQAAAARDGLGAGGLGSSGGGGEAAAEETPHLLLLLRAAVEALLHARQAPPEGWALLPLSALVRVLDDEASLEDAALVACMYAALRTACTMHAHVMRTARTRRARCAHVRARVAP